MRMSSFTDGKDRTGERQKLSWVSAPSGRGRAASSRHPSPNAQEPPQLGVEMRAVLDFAFPQSQDFPSQVEQLLLVRLVSAPIPCQFWKPVLPANGRKTPTVGAIMLVPEATVDEDHFAAGGEHEVRLARQVPTMKAKAIAQPMRPTTDGHLDGCVLGRDRSHDPASLGCDRVRAPERSHDVAPALAHRPVGTGECRVCRAGASERTTDRSNTAGRSHRRAGETTHGGDAIPRNEIKVVQAGQRLRHANLRRTTRRGATEATVAQCNRRAPYHTILRLPNSQQSA